MNKAKRYSIWSMSAGEIYRKLAKIISQLSKKYSNFTSNFEPHATLLTDGEEILNDLGREFEISFEVKRIHLFTSGEVKDWHQIRELLLKF